MKKTRNVTPPEHPGTRTLKQYWHGHTRYPGVTGSGQTGETKGRQTPKRGMKGSRGVHGRKYTSTEKSFLKGLTSGRAI